MFNNNCWGIRREWDEYGYGARSRVIKFIKA
jgi:hypothetical protein